MKLTDIQREPAVIVSTLTAFLTAAIGLVVAFGMDVTDDQKNAILGVLAPAVGLILLVGPVIRGLVFSPNTVRDKVEDAYTATPGIDPKPEV